MLADLLVVGGGIVGLSAAWAFARRHPGATVAVLEKENDVGLHQSSRNSGVIHSGVYYKPGSLKARNCARGREMMLAFCREHALPHELCGKVIVALDDEEMDRVRELARRGERNGVRCELIGADALREREPACAGIGGLLVHDAGIVDFGLVCGTLADMIRGAGGEIRTGVRVARFSRRPDGLAAETSQGPVRARLAVNAAGLHSDRIARASGVRTGIRIVPFRGEYRRLSDEAASMCRHLIYPAPHPLSPFLGVHFTRMISGEIECGPNAVPALAREGYSWGRISACDLAESFTSRAVWRMSMRYWRMGLGQAHRSLSDGAFLKSARRLLPDLRAGDLRPGRSGVRAQPLRPDGTLHDDFAIEVSDRAVHVLSAPSPAATSALSIGEAIADRLDGAAGA